MDGGIATVLTVAARTHVVAPDWRAAIRAACHPLVEAGALEQRYEDRCLAVVEEQGPYFVIAPGIALPHARPEDGVLQLGLGVATLARPVPFGHPNNDPVDLVIAFGSPDRESHVGLLSSLARHLLDGLGDRLRGARSEAEACAFLKDVVDDAA